MNKIVKKILRETYEKQYLKNLCNIVTTGNNHESIEFMNKLFQDINNLPIQLDPNILNKINEIKKKWMTDINSNNEDKPNKGGLKNATGDSEGDISNIYFSEIQDILCPIFMKMN